MVLSMDRWVGKVAVVTGANADSGPAITERLVELGLIVAGMQRRQNRLEYLTKRLVGKKGRFHAVPIDIDDEETVVDAFKWIRQNLGPIHILVNNAAMSRPTTVGAGTTEEWNSIFDINVIELCVATRETLEDMKANNVDGHIIHINSTKGHTASIDQGLGVYSASKFAVRALAEALRQELNASKSKIKITNLSLGLFHNEVKSSGLSMDELRKEGKLLEAEQIADAAVYVLSTPPHVQIQELTIRPIFDLA